jgi:hypothetical protein
VSAWLRALADWTVASRDIALRMTGPANYSSVLGVDGCSPTYERIRAALSEVGREGSMREVLTLMKSMRDLVTTAEPEIVVAQWTSTGCVSSGYPAFAAELVRLLVNDTKAAIVGTPQDESEKLAADVLVALPGNMTTSQPVATDVECFASVDRFILALEPTDFASVPSIGIRILSRQLRLSGAPTPTFTFDCLQTLAVDLAAMPAEILPAAIRSMVAAIWPLAARPQDLDERTLRGTSSTNAPALTSAYGEGKRLTISHAGPGWRLHFWRVGSHVTFANAVRKSSLRITDGPIAEVAWPQ